MSLSDQQPIAPAADAANSRAKAAMVLGIVGAVVALGIRLPVFYQLFMVAALALAVVAIVFGHIGVVRSMPLGGAGRSQAIAGLILGYLTILFVILTY